ncbi:MAG: glycosyltransferase family 2 protein, partial [Rhodothermia bacterium]
NRPDDLKRLLESLATQEGMDRRLILIVDASDDGPRAMNEGLTGEAGRGSLKVRYARFDERPSLARQRNFGVDLLPPEVVVVHFLDDDATLGPGCLDRLSGAFSDPEVFGAGGKVEVPGKSVRRPTLLGRLFLLDSSTSGVLLASGASTSGQARASGSSFDTGWLGGCASYRREVLLAERFDSRLEGYSLDEDLDLSYRVGHKGRLMVIPSAVVYHHESEKERANPRDYAHDHLVHRYWFLEKNVRHPLRKPAFWWSTIGRVLAARFSSDETSAEEVAGLIAGARTVWKRAHPLLNQSPSGS